jgi:hypothetical protein
MLADDERPVWSQMSFTAAADGFHEAARHGLDARLYWPGLGEVPATELILRRLLPLAYDGLDLWGIDGADRDRLLGIVEGRCLSGRNGATWQTETVHALEARGTPRERAVREMTVAYRELMHANEPVHTWPPA